MKKAKIIAAAIASIIGIGTSSVPPVSVKSKALTTADVITDSPVIAYAENTAKNALGDTNNDNMVNASDASNVLVEYSNLSTGKPSIFTNEQKISADVNSDGKIDASDASLILVYYSYVSTGGTITNMKDYLESLAGNPPTTTTAPVTSTTTNPSSVTTVSATGSGRVSDIRVSRTEMSINTGEGEIAAYVTMLPASAKNKNEIWTSSNTNIATVDGEGWVTGISAGTCTVTVKSADNPDVYSEIKITVIDNKNVSDIRLNRTQMTVKVGYGEIAAYVTMLPASAIDKSEEWTSSNPEIATVDSQGWVTGKKAGTAKITVRSVNNPAVFGTVLVTVVDENTVVTTVSTQTTATNTSTVSANTTTSTADVPIEMIQVGENNITLSKNAQKQISYRVVPSSASDKPLKWTSDNESVATVDNNGIVTGIGEGTAVITVSSADNPNIHTNITVTVTKSAGTVTGIELSKYEMKLKVGGKDIAWVSMYPPEATNKNERWTSSNPDIAKVDRFGWVTGISEGECTVTVRSEDNPEISASIKVIVTNGEIDITPTVPDFSALKDGLSTDTHLAFATPVPADAKGQFAVEYLITDLNGKTSAITIPSVTVPDSKYFVGMLTADTNEFTAESFLINLENNSKCKIGTYTFRINPRDAETIDENIIEAFKAVGGISESKE